MAFATFTSFIPAAEVEVVGACIASIALILVVASISVMPGVAEVEVVNALIAFETAAAARASVQVYVRLQGSECAVVQPPFCNVNGRS